MKKWIAAFLASLLMIVPAKVSMAFAPWSKAGETFIGSDGKTLQGALEKGITISKYQNRAGELNWKQIALQDITFAMICLGYYGEKDPYFDINIKNATAHGMKPGVYFNSDALTKEEAEKEARYVLDIIKDYPVAYPVALDMDTSYLAGQGLTKKQVTDLVNAFCKVISGAGYCPVVYGNYEALTQYMEIEKMPYDVWYARYGVGSKFKNRTLWQCTDTGTVDGIKGLVCLEFAFENYQEMFQGTEWRDINGKEYYFQNYSMVKDSAIDIDGEIYWFDENGETIRSEPVS